MGTIFFCSGLGLLALAGAFFGWGAFFVPLAEALTGALAAFGAFFGAGAFAAFLAGTALEALTLFALGAGAGFFLEEEACFFRSDFAIGGSFLWRGLSFAKQKVQGPKASPAAVAFREGS
ncbi:MAG TPA: hypothetical protein VIM58_06810 [Candidatus Methylacidiphilales bacterium]